MKTEEYIGSGILEQYVLGCISASESQEVELMAANNDAVRMEIEAIREALEAYALAHVIAPDPIVKPFLLATIDYSERMKNGETASEPPFLTEKSVIADYDKWLNRSDMVPWNDQAIYAKIIGYTPQALTAIVWLKDYAPQEVHDNELEKFLIVEGTCDVIVGDEINPLFPGDYFTIPLHKKHMIKVTSTIPCKVILQRVAA
jgi:mannose-6-phosphate isomerase-like protein (cupin superfamily)